MGSLGCFLVLESRAHAELRGATATARIAAVGDLWAPLLAAQGRFDLAPLLGAIR